MTIKATELNQVHVGAADDTMITEAIRVLMKPQPFFMLTDIEPGIHHLDPEMRLHFNSETV